MKRKMKGKSGSISKVSFCFMQSLLKNKSLVTSLSNDLKHFEFLLLKIAISFFSKCFICPRARIYFELQNLLFKFLFAFPISVMQNIGEEKSFKRKQECSQNPAPLKMKTKPEKHLYIKHFLCKNQQKFFNASTFQMRIQMNITKTMMRKALQAAQQEAHF